MKKVQFPITVMLDKTVFSTSNPQKKNLETNFNWGERNSDSFWNSLCNVYSEKEKKNFKIFGNDNTKSSHYSRSSTGSVECEVDDKIKVNTLIVPTMEYVERILK